MPRHQRSLNDKILLPQPLAARVEPITAVNGATNAAVYGGEPRAGVFGLRSGTDLLGSRICR